MKILVTPTSFGPKTKSKAQDMLCSFADEVVYNPYGRPIEEEELITLLEGVDGYIAGLDYITEKGLKSAKNLKVISRYGSGYDRVDIKAANDRGIIVTNTPGANSQAVADLAFGLILSVARRIPMLDRKTKSCEWIRSTGIELYEKTIGIIGLGAIGKNVAKRAAGFSMRVLAYDPYIDYEYCKANGIIPVSFDELIEKSDILSLHLPLNDKTRYIINADTIKRVKKGVIIINTARGGLIDEGAVCEALKNGKVGGLGLDAFEKEPPEYSELFKFDNVVMTPHTGSHTGEATQNMATMSVQNLIDVLSGKECKNVVNKDVYI